MRPDATPRHRQNLALAYVLSGQAERAATLPGGEHESADAQRSIMRYAGILALPDHAARVAALAAVRVSPSPLPAPAILADEPFVAVPSAPFTATQPVDSRASPPVTAAWMAPAGQNRPQPIPRPERVNTEPALAVPAPGDMVPPSAEDRLGRAAQAYDAGDFETAAKLWQPLAEAGNVRAQFHLGSLYFEGRGVTRDLTTSYMLLRQAELAGFADARIILALVEDRLSVDERREAEAQLAVARP